MKYLLQFRCLKEAKKKKGNSVELGNKDLFGQPRIVPYHKHLTKVP